MSIIGSQEPTCVAIVRFDNLPDGTGPRSVEQDQLERIEINLRNVRSAERYRYVRLTYVIRSDCLRDDEASAERV